MNETELLRKSAAAFVAVAATAVAAWLGAVILRDGLVARDDLGALCSAPIAPAWCALRQLVIQAFLHHAFSYSSVALAAIALWRGSSLAAHGAIVAGIAGLVLWDHGWSAAGVLAGALVAARVQGQRQQHAQPERGA